MKIIRSKWFPFKRKSVNIFGVLFIRKGVTLAPHEINREKIRSEQMAELNYIGYYAIYGLEWLLSLVIEYEISFEEELREHQHDYKYLESRKAYAMWRNE